MKLRSLAPLFLLCLCFTANGAEEVVAQKNVLLICIDDLRPELNSFGAGHIHSPNIDGLAAQGRSFHRHYVNASSCGPSRYAMLTGLYPISGKSNNHLVARAKEMAKDPAGVLPSMPEWFRKKGYTTVSVGKVSHYPGGLTGKGWADDSRPEMPDAWDRHLMPVGEWGNPEGAMHGYANGKVRAKKKEDDVYESIEGADRIYPDGLITEEGIKQLEELAASAGLASAGEIKPFFLAIGLIKPHLPFGAPKKYLDLYEGVDFPPIPHTKKPQGRTTWGGSGEFMKYNRWGKDPRNDPAFALEVRKHYAACVSYADKQVGDILAKLKETGADRNTIIVLWGDHGWHLGEHGVWGKHTLFEESLLAPLIIVDPSVVDAGVATDAVVDTTDLFPTLCDLAGVEIPDFTRGVSLRPFLNDPTEKGHAALAYYRDAKTVRDDRYRLIVHKDGYVELYDHSSPEGETRNISDEHPDVVLELKESFSDKLGR